MIKRPFWEQKIKKAWEETSIVWLSGVRRSGKTTIAGTLAEENEALYLDCDLPAIEEMVHDPELFYKNCSHKIIIFDEVHQLKDPARLLKIGADLFPRHKILATGSSTLSATKKFRDTLSGRKRNVHLLPTLWCEFGMFNEATLEKRLFHGGLPQPLMADKKSASFFREWTDSFFSRDIQKLFSFRDASKFSLVLEYLMRQSGGFLESVKISSALGISRPTIESHVRALEITHTVNLLRPFFGGGRKEIVKIPKCYSFDTGFVSFFKGWDPLRPSDFGILWEHFVLEQLVALNPFSKIHYWRDLSGREVDFIIPRNRDAVDAVECKWKLSEFDVGGLKKFRYYYPKGSNYLICPLPETPYKKEFSNLLITVCSPSALFREWNK